MALSPFVLAANPLVTLTKPVSYVRGATVDINFTVVDTNIASGADHNFQAKIYYSQNIGDFNFLIVDLNLLNGTACASTDFTGAAVTCSYDWNTLGVSDGNYFIDMNVIDSNNQTLTQDWNSVVTRGTDTNLSFMVDNTIPVIHHTTGANRIVVDFNRTRNVDNFFGTDQNITIVASPVINDANSSPIQDINIAFGVSGTFPGVTDMNSLCNVLRNDSNKDQNGSQSFLCGEGAAADGNITDFNVSMTKNADGNFTYDLNLGMFDINFAKAYFVLRAKDTAGNVSDWNYSTIAHPILYTIKYPQGFDQNSDSTSLQDVSNFASISSFVVSKTGFGTLTFSQTLVLDTNTKASSLTALGTYIKLTAVGSNDMNVSIDANAIKNNYADANYNLITAASLFLPNQTAMPGIFENDANCSDIICSSRAFNTTTKRFTFTLTPGSTSTAFFKSYITNGTAPVVSGGSPSGTLGVTTTSTTLQVTTDENASCRYGTVVGTGYDTSSQQMSANATGTTHTATTTVATPNSYTFYVRCKDEVDNKNADDYTISFNVQSTNGGGSSGSGGSGGSGTANNNPTVSITVVNAQTGQTLSIPAHNRGLLNYPENGAGLTVIRIESTSTISGKTPTVKVGSKPVDAPEVSGVVNRYIEIDSTITPSAFSSATIVFTVEKSWLTQQSIELSSVKLWRWANGVWTALTTTKVSEDSTTITFEATSPGFSTFAVAGTVATTTPPVTPPTDTGGDTTTGGTDDGTTGTDTGTPPATDTGTGNETPAQPSNIPWLPIGVVIVLILVGVFVWPKLGKKKGW